MEITLGDKIKINGEEVPEYLLKALYEHLKLRYPVVPTGYINCSSIKAGKIQANGLKASSLPPLDSQSKVQCMPLMANGLRVRPDLIRHL
ncbi:hypothetical protein MUU45_001139 [Rodentibacter pneumotropicus]|uniref:Uncharacterized protein n=1 Tax=Rodentibacter pneumotropicus TaxID=758 RepID=A0AAW5LBZ3_9PAST|nr:hypothetical protein [Rodentibacter pneumotropicus]MCQ9121590.1 hypothetical protein [Rodentibacter pneumotropicus]